MFSWKNPTEHILKRLQLMEDEQKSLRSQHENMIKTISNLESKVDDKDKKIINLENQLKVNKTEMRKKFLLLNEHLDQVEFVSKTQLADILETVEENLKDHQVTNVEYVNLTQKSLDRISTVIQHIHARSVQDQAVTIGILRTRPEVVRSILDIFQDQISQLEKTLNIAKEQFQSKMDKIKEESLKSDTSFLKNFPSLSHPSIDKNKNSPGFKISKISKKDLSQGNTATFILPNAKITPVHHTFKNSKGGYDQVARIIEIKSLGNSAWWSFSIIEGAFKPAEKTVLMVGATGAGKSTLIDGIANFIYDVRFEDSHRLKLINLLEEEKAKVQNQALSQTDDITVYRIPYMKESNIPFILNIIDTPGKI